MRVGILAGFTKADNELLQAWQAALAIENEQLPQLFGVNMASWLLPHADAASNLLKPLGEIQQLDVSLYPIIDLSFAKPQFGLQVVMTHILNHWHFSLHKACELPYLADDERDVPKRWRPFIPLAQIDECPDLSILPALPKTLHCQELLLVDKEQRCVIERQGLAEMDAIPW